MKITALPAIVLTIICSASASAQTTPSTPFCFGDGTGTLCPCGNFGPVGTGCGNSSGAAVHLTSSGFAGSSDATDTLVLTVNVPSTWGFFFQGTSQAAGGLGVQFGDGLFCVDGTVIRLGVVFNSFGIASYPGGLTPAPIHTAGGNSSGDVRHYQCWYRDATPFCSPATANTTNGLTLTWAP